MSTQSADDVPEAEVPVRQPGAVRAAVAVTGLILAYCGVLGVAVSLFLPWYAFGSLPHPEQEPGGRGVKAAVVLLLIALALLAFAWPRSSSWAARGRMYRRIGVLILSGGLLALVLLQADGLGRLWPVRPGGWLAVFGAVAEVLGWLLLALAPPWQAAGPQSWQVKPAAAIRRRSAMAVGCAAAVLLAAVATFAGTSSAAVTVQNSTASALPALAAAAAQDPGRVRWQLQLGRDEQVGAVSGRYMLVSQLDGVKVLDSATGRTLWYYLRRYDEYGLDDSVLSPDGHTVYAIFYARGANDDAAAQNAVDYTVVALDTATGTVRWQWTTSAAPSSDKADDSITTPWEQGSSWQAVGDELVHVDQARQSVAAAGWDARTGARAWSAQLPSFAAAQQQCSILAFEGNAAASAAGVLAVLEFCGSSNNPVGQLLGISESSGKQLWSVSLATLSNPIVGAVPGLGFLVGDITGNDQYADTATLLAAATGQKLDTFTEAAGSDGGGYDGLVQGGDPELSLLPGADTLALTAYTSNPWAETWTATVPAATGNAVDPFRAATCSGAAFASVYNGTRVSLVEHAGTVGAAAATYAEPGIEGKPTVLACAPGEVLVEAAYEGTAVPSPGDMLYALG